MSNPPFGVDHRAVLTLRGDVDFFSEDEFRANAEILLDDDDVSGLVVDLAEVTMMDSSGLSLLVDLLRLCDDMKLPMTIREVPPRVEALLDVTGLNQIMTHE